MVGTASAVLPAKKERKYRALFASLLQLIFLYGLYRFCMAMLYILYDVCPL